MSDLTSTSEIVIFYITHGLTEKILAAHVDDGTGHCAGCAWQQRAQPVHPCPLRYCAEVAAEQERGRCAPVVRRGVPPLISRRIQRGGAAT